MTTATNDLICAIPYFQLMMSDCSSFRFHVLTAFSLCLVSFCRLRFWLSALLPGGFKRQPEVKLALLPQHDSLPNLSLFPTTHLRFTSLRFYFRKQHIRRYHPFCNPPCSSHRDFFTSACPCDIRFHRAHFKGTRAL